MPNLPAKPTTVCQQTEMAIATAQQQQLQLLQQQKQQQQNIET